MMNDRSSFGSIVDTGNSTLQTTCTNTGNANLTVSSVAMAGGSSSYFTVAAGGTCVSASPIGANGTCVINVQFAPTTTGYVTGTVNISTNVTGSPQTVPVNGTGVAVGTTGLSVAQPQSPI